MASSVSDAIRYPDVSDPPDDSLRTIASAALKYVGSSLTNANVAWVLQATPAGVVSGSTVSLTIPDLSMQILGRVGFSTYPTASWSGLPIGTPVLLYLTDDGTDPPAFSFTAGTTLPVGASSFTYPVMVGQYNATTGFSQGAATATTT